MADKNKFDISKIFGKKSLVAWSIVVLILVAMFFSIYFRSYSSYLPITEDWARDTAYSNIRSQVAAQINANYPHLDASQKSQLIEQEFQTFIKANQGSLDDQIQASADYFKSQLQDDSGQTYLLAIDPYQHWRQTQNVLDNGHPGDVLKDGKPWNDHKVAPLGTPAYPQFHTVFSAWIFKLVYIFNHNVSLFTIMFWIPVIISSLCVIPAFFIANKRIGIFGGFIAAIFVAIHPIFIGRTAGGFADTDAYVVLFSLLILWTFLEAFEAKTWRKRSILIAVSGFFAGGFAFAWTAWWFTFDLLVGAMLMYIWFLLVQKFIGENKTLKWKIIYFIWSIVLAPLYLVYLIYLLVSYLKEKAKQKDPELTKILNTFALLLLFVGFCALFVILFKSSTDFTRALTGPFQRAATLKTAVRGDLWPNVYTTVAELNPASIPSIINQIGGRLFFIIASLGVILTMLPKKSWKVKSWAFAIFSLLMFIMLTAGTIMNINTINYFLLLSVPMLVGLFLNLKKDEKVDVKYAILLLLWFVGSMFAATKGTRFTLLLVPAFAVAMGIAVGYIYSIFSNLVWKEFQVSKLFARILLIVILLLLLIAPMKTANQTAQREVPSMDDAWYGTLTGIRDASEPDAIINSWWDFGHWFKAIGDRAVTFDGGSQNTPMAHWIGHVLITWDEQKAVGLLRMLDCGSNTAFEKLSEYIGDDLEAINIIYELVVFEDQASAEQFLRDKGLSVQEAGDVLQYTHCEPPEDYFITSEDMVGKAGVWGHFGSWDFEKATSYTLIKGKKSTEAVDILKRELGMTNDEANDRYFEIQSKTSDRAVNTWISPWPNYLFTEMRSCTVEGDEVTCAYNRNVGTSPDGSQSTVVEKGVFNLTDISKSRLTLGFYLRSSGAKVGEKLFLPKEVVLADEDGFTHHIPESTKELESFSFTIILEEKEDGTYRSLMCDPLFAESTFTKLFFMDGRYMEHFDHFSTRNSVRGEKIVVWKVDWDGKEDIVVEEPVVEELEEDNATSDVDDILESIMFR